MKARWVRVIEPPEDCWALADKHGSMLALCAPLRDGLGWGYTILDPVERRRIQGRIIGGSRHEAFEEVEGTLVSAGTNLGPTFIQPPPPSRKP